MAFLHTRSGRECGTSQRARSRLRESSRNQASTNSTEVPPHPAESGPDLGRIRSMSPRCGRARARAAAGLQAGKRRHGVRRSGREEVRPGQMTRVQSRTGVTQARPHSVCSRVRSGIHVSEFGRCWPPSAGMWPNSTTCCGLPLAKLDPVLTEFVQMLSDSARIWPNFCGSGQSWAALAKAGPDSTNVGQNSAELGAGSGRA